MYYIRTVFVDFIFDPFWSTSSGAAVISAVISSILAVVISRLDSVRENKKRQHESVERQKDRDNLLEQQKQSLKLDQHRLICDLLEQIGGYVHQHFETWQDIALDLITLDILNTKPLDPSEESYVEDSKTILKKSISRNANSSQNAIRGVEKNLFILKSRDIRSAEIASCARDISKDLTRTAASEVKKPETLAKFSERISNYQKMVCDYRNIYPKFDY